MRARKKKHTAERLELCGDIVVKNAEGNAGLWSQIFNNTNPCHLEIGCGKGSFIVEMAKRNPNINFIALEKIGDILVMAAEEALPLSLQNLRFVNSDAMFLPYMFQKGELSVIYLNFSDPWPSSKKIKKRLTHKDFALSYKKILNKKGEIHLKTDNKDLFEFSLEELSHCGFYLKDITFDLHNSSFKENVLTEYEKKFLEQGLPIHRAVAVKNI